MQPLGTINLTILTNQLKSQQVESKTTKVVNQGHSQSSVHRIDRIEANKYGEGDMAKPLNIMLSLNLIYLKK